MGTWMGRKSFPPKKRGGVYVHIWLIPFGVRQKITHCKAVGGSLVAQLCLTLATLWTVARPAPLSMGFPRQECWSGLPYPPPGDLPDPGVEPGSPALQAVSLPTDLPGKPVKRLHSNKNYKKKKLKWWASTDKEDDSVLQQSLYLL